VLLVAFFLWQASVELTKIDVQGLSRLDAGAVLATVGLKTGATAGKPEFDTGCQKLIRSGLFERCDWKTIPTSASAATLVLQLKEAEAGQTVRFSVPGVDDKQLWEWLRANEPLVKPQMPASDEAIQFYTRAVQRFLKKDIVPVVHSNLETKENTLVFRPANAPTITAVKFVGTKAIDAATLEKTFLPIAKGTPFTEYEVQQLLNAGIRPLYENLGRLNVSFPSITAEGGAVTIQVQEGRIYKLGKFEAIGAPAGSQPNVATGQTAEWNKIVASLDTVSKTLRDQGYLDARYKVERQLNHEAGTVDLVASYTPGRLFTFQSLRLEGLNTPQEANVRALWKLSVGAPMKESYVQEFLTAAFDKLGPEFSGVGHQLEQAGGDAVNVVITFRRQ
jgi:outer membrane protein assembly factor BamA